MQNRRAWPDQDSYPILSDSEVDTLSLAGVKGRRRKLKQREAIPHHLLGANQILSSSFLLLTEKCLGQQA